MLGNINIGKERELQGIGHSVVARALYVMRCGDTTSRVLWVFAFDIMYDIGLLVVAYICLCNGCLVAAWFRCG